MMADRPQSNESEFDADPKAFLRKLRAAAADLHPDRGGDPAAFIKAHAEYRKYKIAYDLLKKGR
jgi:hypothetical protein